MKNSQNNFFSIIANINILHPSKYIYIFSSIFLVLVFSLVVAVNLLNLDAYPVWNADRLDMLFLAGSMLLCLVFFISLKIKSLNGELIEIKRKFISTSMSNHEIAHRVRDYTYDIYMACSDAEREIRDKESLEAAEMVVENFTKESTNILKRSSRLIATYAKEYIDRSLVDNGFSVSCAVMIAMIRKDDVSNSESVDFSYTPQVETDKISIMPYAFDKFSFKNYVKPWQKDCVGLLPVQKISQCKLLLQTYNSRKRCFCDLQESRKEEGYKEFLYDEILKANSKIIAPIHFKSEKLKNYLPLGFMTVTSQKSAYGNFCGDNNNSEIYNYVGMFTDLLAPAFLAVHEAKNRVNIAYRNKVGAIQMKRRSTDKTSVPQTK